MIVTCEQCQTRFRMPIEKIGAGGARVRCAKCKHVFRVSPSPPKEEPPPTAYAQKGTAEHAANVVAPPPSEIEEEISSSELEITQSAVEPASSLLDSLFDKQSQESAPVAPAREELTPGKGAPPLPTTTSRPEHRISKNTSIPKAAPLVRSEVSWPHRFARFGVILTVALTGVTLGLFAMGVPPTPTSLSLLSRFGKRVLIAGLHVIDHRAQVVRTGATEQLFIVRGTVLNRTRRRVSQATLRLEVFAPDGSFLSRATAPCCSSPLDPMSTTSFSMRTDIPSVAVGSYRISFEGSDSDDSEER